MVINDDGLPISIPFNGSAVVSDTIGAEMLTDGLAEEYEETSPTGTITINDNGVYDVFDYAYASVNVPKGGGGGGDYDIFHVTITDETGSGRMFYLPNIMREDGMTALSSSYMLSSNEPETVEVVGYDGTAFGIVPVMGAEVTGDITKSEAAPDTFFVITGDGTITIPDK